MTKKAIFAKREDKAATRKVSLHNIVTDGRTRMGKGKIIDY